MRRVVWFIFSVSLFGVFIPNVFSDKDVSVDSSSDIEDDNETFNDSSDGDCTSVPDAEQQSDDDTSNDDSLPLPKASKSTISKALNYSSSWKRRVIRHKYKIVLAMAVYAFRHELMNEIQGIFLSCVSTPVHDSETGALVGRRLNLDTAKSVKLVMVVAVMWRIYKIGNGVSPSTALLLGQLTGFRNVAMILAKWMAPSNNAYLPPVVQHYTFERINKRYEKDHMALSKALGLTIARNSTMTKHPESLLAALGAKSQTRTMPYNRTTVVIDWNGLDSTVSQLDKLRDEISFLVAQHDSGIVFDVAVLLESPGGSAADYSLASQQIVRLRERGIEVTVCVDKVAASGGYMIACCSSPGRLFAAPFAVVGSIGVIGQIVNVHKVLQGWGVTPLTFRGGKDKAPLSLVGEVTKEGMEKTQQMIDVTHTAFKKHVVSNRPILREAIDTIATGDIWLGQDALDIGLVDRITTSDDYVSSRIRDGTLVLKLKKLVRQGFFGLSSASGGRVSIANSHSINRVSMFGLLADFRCLMEKVSSVLATLREFGNGLEISPLRHTPGANACMGPSDNCGS